MISDKTIGVIGLGYVGLPLAVTFGQKFRTIGFDIKMEAIENYRKKVDLNGEVDEAGFEAARCLSFKTEAKDLQRDDFIIVAVPTPIDSANQPYLSTLEILFLFFKKEFREGTYPRSFSGVRPLISASRTAGEKLKKGR